MTDSPAASGAPGELLAARAAGSAPPISLPLALLAAAGRQRPLGLARAASPGSGPPRRGRRSSSSNPARAPSRSCADSRVLGTDPLRAARPGLSPVGSRSAPSLKAGEYDFASGLSTVEILDKLRRGEIRTVAVTLVEGLTVDETAQALAAAGLGELGRLRAEFASPDGSPISTRLPDTSRATSFRTPIASRAAPARREIADTLVATFRRLYETRVRPLRAANDTRPASRTGDPRQPGREGGEARLRTAAHRGGLRQPPAARHRPLRRSDDHPRPQAPRSLERQPDQERPADGVALEHLPRPGPATGTDLLRRTRQPRGRGTAGPSLLPLLRQSQRRQPRLRRHPGGAQPECRALAEAALAERRRPGSLRRARQQVRTPRRAKPRKLRH